MFQQKEVQTRQQYLDNPTSRLMLHEVTSRQFGAEQMIPWDLR